jgi:hypothetical protein
MTKVTHETEIKKPKDAKHRTKLIDPHHSEEDHPVSKHHAYARSHLWEGVEKAFIRQHPVCVVCGAKDGLNVHHKYPISYVLVVGRPDLEFDCENLVTLCARADDHHLLLGHLDSFRSYNPNLEDDLKLFKGMTGEDIRKNREYRQKIKDRPLPCSEMSDKEKNELLVFLNKRFPQGVRTRRQAKSP